MEWSACASATAELHTALGSLGVGGNQPVRLLQRPHTLRYLDLVLPRVTPQTPSKLPLVVAFKAQMTEVVSAFAWSRRLVLVIHGGGATGIAQPIDTDIHLEMQRLYVELEMSDAVARPLSPLTQCTSRIRGPV